MLVRRGRRSTCLCAALTLAVVVSGLAVAAARAGPPGTASEERRAQQVLAQIQQIDLELNRASEAWDGARIRLASTERAVKANRRDLRRTRRQYGLAQRRLERLLVTLYVSDQPSSLEVILGATSLSDLIDRLDVAQRVTSSETKIADDVARLRERLRKRDQELRHSLQAERMLVGELGQRRDGIASQLAARRRLLGSIQGQIARLKARERARERALAAQARARVAAELRARLRAEQAARAQAARVQAEQAAAARARAAAQQHQGGSTPPAPASPPATKPSPAPQPSPIPTVPTTAPPSTTPTPTTPTPTTPAPSPGSGHPEVVPIALRYLGVPYRWGGASPTTGFDCSGFVMFVYAQIGISLPHYAAAQYQLGAPVSRDQLQPGDLVFFDQLNHVGIYIGAGQFVHAPHTGDVVRISSLSEAWFASHYVGARRI